MTAACLGFRVEGWVLEIRALCLWIGLEFLWLDWDHELFQPRFCRLHLGVVGPR